MAHIPTETQIHTYITLFQVPSDEFNLYNNSKIERKVAFDQNIMFMFSNDLYCNSKAIKIRKKYKSHHSKIKDQNKWNMYKIWYRNGQLVTLLHLFR